MQKGALLKYNCRYARRTHQHSSLMRRSPHTRAIQDEFGKTIGYVYACCYELLRKQTWILVVEGVLFSKIIILWSLVEWHISKWQTVKRRCLPISKVFQVPFAAMSWYNLQNWWKVSRIEAREATTQWTMEVSQSFIEAKRYGTKRIAAICRFKGDLDLTSMQQAKAFANRLVTPGNPSCIMLPGDVEWFLVQRTAANSIRVKLG